MFPIHKRIFFPQRTYFTERRFFHHKVVFMYIIRIVVGTYLTPHEHCPKNYLESIKKIIAYNNDC